MVVGIRDMGIGSVVLRIMIEEGNWKIFQRRGKGKYFDYKMEKQEL